MSYSIRFDDGSDDDEVFSLATTQGLADLSAWVATLDTDAHSLLHALVNDGHAKDTRTLAGQLSAALKAYPPADPDVVSTAKGLLDQIGIGDADETAIITDGE